MQASNKWLLLADPEAGTLVSWPFLRLSQGLLFVHVHVHWPHACVDTHLCLFETLPATTRCA